MKAYPVLGSSDEGKTLGEGWLRNMSGGPSVRHDSSVLQSRRKTILSLQLLTHDTRYLIASAEKEITTRIRVS